MDIEAGYEYALINLSNIPKEELEKRLEAYKHLASCGNKTAIGVAMAIADMRSGKIETY